MSATAWLTTLRSDGSPHVTPVWFVQLPGLIWIATASTNAKVRNVIGNDRVALAFEIADIPYVAEGVASLRDSADDWQLLAPMFADKYDGWDAADPTVDGTRTLMRVEVRKWLLGDGVGCADE